MILEGIIIHKTPFKERDVICNLLLRSGKVLSVYFYGGRGGGKSNKGSVLELGHLISITLSPRKKKIDTDIKIAKEYQLKWSGGKIRANYQAFCLSSFFLEVIGMIAVDDDLDHQEDQEYIGLFNVLSNSLFYLNKFLDQNNFSINDHLFVFLMKLSLQLGIIPDLDNCLYCSKEFQKNDLCLFDVTDGGYICLECTSQKDQFLSENKDLREEFQSSQVLRSLMKDVLITEYKNLSSIEHLTSGHSTAVFNFFNYHFGFQVSQYKTWGMLQA